MLAKRLCVVGSGPAGFYTAYRVLKNIPHVEVDMLEALPVPYGLVRYGVAPDHPEVKAVQHKFEEIALDPRFSFIGNIRLGIDVSVQQLRAKYDSVVLAYGAAKDRTLGIPGETSLRGVLAARDFVGWYNGQPNHRQLQPDLGRSDTAVVIGHGNVALDVARILLSPVDQLAKTDIAQFALETLSQSKIKRVLLIGRRGPVQASFTARELREMFQLPNVAVHLDRQYIQQQKEQFSAILERDRPKRRLLDLMESYKMPAAADRDCLFHFMMRPTEFLPHSTQPLHVGAVRLERTRLLSDGDSPKAVGTGEFENIDCGLVLRSIGYKSVAVEGAPFDNQRGLVPNVQGRVIESSDAHADVVPGLYVSGWLKTGPMGVIATTMFDAYQTADCIIADIQQNIGIGRREPSKSRQEFIDWLRREQQARPVTFADWKRVEQEEERRGRLLGKPREKLSSVEDILRIIDELDGNK